MPFDHRQTPQQEFKKAHRATRLRGTKNPYVATGDLPYWVSGLILDVAKNTRPLKQDPLVVRSARRLWNRASRTLKRSALF